MSTLLLTMTNLVNWLTSQGGIQVLENAKCRSKDGTWVHPGRIHSSSSINPSHFPCRSLSIFLRRRVRETKDTIQVLGLVLFKFLLLISSSIHEIDGRFFKFISVCTSDRAFSRSGTERNRSRSRTRRTNPVQNLP